VKKKKVNPRRIPLAKSAIDKNAIIEEAMKDDMSHAWLLVASSLVEQEHISADELSELSDAVNAYISNKTFKSGSDNSELTKAEKLMGRSNPYNNLDPSRIHSQVELEAFKQKVVKVAIHTALSVICLGLDSTGRFSEEDFHRIFLGVDLTLAEIESGVNSYEEIEQALISQMVKIDVDENDKCTVEKICNDENSRT
jgi:hypothetical protein